MKTPKDATNHDIPQAKIASGSKIIGAKSQTQFGNISKYEAEIVQMKNEITSWNKPDPTITRGSRYKGKTTFFTRLDCAAMTEGAREKTSEIKEWRISPTKSTIAYGTFVSSPAVHLALKI